MPDPITALHYAPNGNIVNNSYAPGSVGFNLADISSAAELPLLPSGVQALAWLGATGGVTASFMASVNSYIGASNLFGIYIADEPDPASTPAANLKAEADYIHATLPGVKTFMVEQNLGSNTNPVYAYTPANTNIDLFGLDPYPVQTNVPNNLDYAIIPLAVSVAEADGIPRQDIVPVYQAFGGGQYTTYILPTAAQEQQILSTWGPIIPNPVFDYAYSWGVQVGDTAISVDPALQQVFAGHNGLPANAPTVNSIGVSGTGIDASGNGDLNAGKIVTLTVGFSEVVTVNTAAGAPTLALNDGGTAAYTGGTGTNALTFSYTVAAGQNISDLVVSSFKGNGAVIQDAAGNNADLSGATNYNPAGTLEIDTATPSVTQAVASPATGNAGTSQLIAIALNMSEAVTVAGGSPTLTLNDGGTASYDAGKSNSTTLVFDYTVASGQSTPALAVTGVTLNGATVQNGAGTAADLAGADVTFSGLGINTTTPSVSSIAASGAGIDAGGNGDLNAGKVVNLTVNFSEAVTVMGGSPSLTLNDGGTATYGGGTGTTALTFSYSVAAGQNTSDLVVSTFNLNGATVQDAAGNNTDLTGATNDNPAGTLRIDTTAPTITINTIAGNNIVTAANASTGFAIGGTTAGAENGQAVTVTIINGAQKVVDSYTTTEQNNAWTTTVTSAQAAALADGGYSVTANVTDKAGNPAQASRALTVDEDKVAESPTLTVAHPSLTVQAGGSVALAITASPVDADDRVSVKISGLPSYETISAPSGDSVTRQRQGQAYTWTVTESASAAGKPLTGLTLTSNYTGRNHPVASLTVTASNTTSGEGASSSPQTLAVTDPPATTSASSIGRLGALLDQFAAAGFHNNPNSAGEIASMPQMQNGFEEQVLLSAPHHAA